MKTPYAACLAGAILLATPLAAAAPVCVLVPHFKDEYWLSVGYGLEQEAAAQGATLWLREAGGYRARESQIAQLGACVAQGAGAVLIGAVTSDHPALLAAVGRAAAKVPVFGLVNDLKSDALSGAVGVDWADMGAAVGDELARLYPAGGAPVRAVLVSGPPEAGWTAPVEQGLRRHLAASSVRIGAVYAADTGLREQFDQTEAALSAGAVDVFIGSAPAVEAAMGWLAAHPDAPRPRLFSTYISHSVQRGLMGGAVEFAAFDDPEEQGRMALRLVAAYLAGEQMAEQDGPQTGPQTATPARTGPAVRPLRAGTPEPAAIRLSPPDYFPRLE